MDTVAFAGLRELRSLAQGLGLDTRGKDREQVMAAINRKKAELTELRAECVKLGVSPDGDEEVLRLRLAAFEPGAITTGDVKLYGITGWVLVGLGVAALAVSLPHVSAELARITGLHWAFAAALAVLMDGGIVAFKLVDVLSGKFKLAKLSRINQVSMFACLALSAAVNASGFARADHSVALAVLFAVFLAGLVWALFFFGAYLLTRMERKGEEVVQAAPVTVDPVSRMRAAANELERLLAIANKV